jgi:hypothetical protein
MLSPVETHGTLMLHDLDELILKCRDDRARAYLREAVICCKAGAYRSAIVSTWIAVAFDIVDKIHELSLAGDKEAISFVESYENSIANENPEKSLKLERDLLALARDKYELISSQEYTDLARLQDDRHRCAHPSRMSFTEVFSPPAELARLHIRMAVEHLLQHEPSQGKAALNALLQQIWSNYFPRNRDKARAILDGTPLRRARPALVRNLLLVLLKTCLAESTEVQQVARNRVAMRCVMEMHPVVWQEVVSSELNRLYRNIVDDKSLSRALQLVQYFPDFADHLEPDQIAHFEQFILNLPVPYVHLCEGALAIPVLASTAKKAIAKLSANEITNMHVLSTSEEVRERIVSAYSRSPSFEYANTWGKVVQMFSDDFTADQTREILQAAATNGEIKGSFQFDAVLSSIKNSARLNGKELDALIAAARRKPEESNLTFDDDIPF